MRASAASAPATASRRQFRLGITPTVYSQRPGSVIGNPGSHSTSRGRAPRRSSPGERPRGRQRSGRWQRSLRRAAKVATRDRPAVSGAAAINCCPVRVKLKRAVEHRRTPQLPKAKGRAAPGKLCVRRDRARQSRSTRCDERRADDRRASWGAGSGPPEHRESWIEVHWLGARHQRGFPLVGPRPRHDCSPP